MNGFFFGILFSGDIDGGMMGAYDAKATVLPMHPAEAEP